MPRVKRLNDQPSLTYNLNDIFIPYTTPMFRVSFRMPV
eukprot:CAMPEP_0194373612 /NCGR_PEP_ID=MMETSP0174-20130528/22090_1 /TAXON_ID=216777 /ORGANISM="Proboscia alata, Strain PI-D3" /LENGTH=37 /DNA_ID= /DNA_START= /DNA_END= /DNA_ORIENTATION=